MLLQSQVDTRAHRSSLSPFLTFPFLSFPFLSGTFPLRRDCEQNSAPAPSRLGADRRTSPSTEPSPPSTGTSAGASAIPRPLCSTRVSTTATTTAAPTSKAPTPPAAPKAASIAIIDTAGAKGLEILLLLFTPPLPATRLGPVGVVAVFALAGDVVEEGGRLVVATSRSRRGSDEAVLASLASGTVDRGVRGAVRGWSCFAGRADGRTAGDGFFDQVLLVELCVGGLEVVVRAWYFDLLVRFVMTAATVPSTPSASITRSISASSGLSGVSDMLVRPHFIDLLRQMLDPICRLLLLIRCGR